MTMPDRKTEPQEYLDVRNENTVQALDYIAATVQDLRFKVDSGQIGFKDDVKIVHTLAGLDQLMQEMVHFYRHEVEWVAQQAIEDHRAKSKFIGLAEDMAPQLIAEVEMFLGQPGVEDRRPGPAPAQD